MVDHLLRRLPQGVRSVSVTTRAARPGEREARAYRFVSRSTFQRMRQNRQLLEYAKVHGAYYGTPKAQVLRTIERGLDCILTIDVQGARQIKRALGYRAVLVFLRPPSMAELQRRLRKRQTESLESLRIRLSAARRELACASWYDYVIVNDHLQEAVKQLEAIIIAQRCRNIST